MINRSALNRAVKERIQVRQVGPRFWTATSSRGGEGYKLAVEPDTGQIRCTCQAGQREIGCKHAALVASRIAELVRNSQPAEQVAQAPRQKIEFYCSTCGLAGCDAANHRVPLLARLMA